MECCSGRSCNADQPFGSHRSLHRARHAAVRGSAFRARERQLHRRPLAAGSELCRVRARAARPRPHYVDRHVGRASQPGCNRRARRRGLSRRRPRRHGAPSQSSRRPRHHDPELPAHAREQDPRPAALAACGRLRALCRRGGRIGRGGNAGGRARCCRGSDCRVPTSAGGDRRHGGARGRRASDLAAGARQPRARLRFRRPRRGRVRHGRRAPRRRRDDPQSAHFQRVHGAACGDRPLRCHGSAIYLDLGMPGRAPLKTRARGLPQSAARTRARDLSRCRRRVRITLQYLSRAGGGGVGGTPSWSCGEMDRGAQRSLPRRLYRARRSHACAARFQSPRPYARAGTGAHRQYRSTHRLLRSAQQRLSGCPDRL